MTDTQKRYRIGIGGIAIESSTFSPLLSTIDDFRIGHGDTMQEMYSYLPNWTYRDRDDIDFIPCLKARAIPGGHVTADAYVTMKSELLERIAAALPLEDTRWLQARCLRRRERMVLHHATTIGATPM